MDQQVPQITTNVSEAEMSRAMFDVAKNNFGVELTKPQLSLLIAQNNLETGSRSQMYNYNIGFIMHTKQDHWDYFIHPDHYTNAQGQIVKYNGKFRAYPTLADGVKDYMTNIKTRGGGRVWDSVLSGSPREFAVALKKTRYYDADVNDYITGVSNHSNKYLKSKSYENGLAGNFTPFKSDAHFAPISSSLGENDDGWLSSFFHKLFSFLSSFASENQNKSLIVIGSNDPITKLEFAEVLQSALEEEMGISSVIHQQNNCIELECAVENNSEVHQAAMKEVCVAMSDVFSYATKNIGSPKVNTMILHSTYSQYPELDVKLSEINHRKFLLKFAKGVE